MILAALAVLMATSNVALAPRVSAKTVCVQLYSGAVECHEEEEPVLGVTHEPVKADLGDVSPAILGGGLLASAGILFYLSRRKALSSFGIK